MTLSDSGSGIVFAGTVTGPSDNLTVSRGATTFDGAVTVASLSAGASTLAADIDTTAGQTYGGAVTLAANVTLSAGTSIVFKGAVTGPDNSLTVASGATTFGAGGSIGSLSVQAATLNGTITTTAGQFYNGAVTLGSNVTLTDAGGVLFSGIGYETGIDTGGGVVEFADGISGAGRSLTVGEGVAELNGTITLGSLSVAGCRSQRQHHDERRAEL